MLYKRLKRCLTQLGLEVVKERFPSVHVPTEEAQYKLEFRDWSGEKLGWLLDVIDEHKKETVTAARVIKSIKNDIFRVGAFNLPVDQIQSWTLLFRIADGAITAGIYSGYDSFEAAIYSVDVSQSPKLVSLYLVQRVPGTGRLIGEKYVIYPRAGQTIRERLIDLRKGDVFVQPEIEFCKPYAISGPIMGGFGDGLRAHERSSSLYLSIHGCEYEEFQGEVVPVKDDLDSRSELLTKGEEWYSKVIRNIDHIPYAMVVPVFALKENVSGYVHVDFLKKSRVPKLSNHKSIAVFDDNCSFVLKRLTSKSAHPNLLRNVLLRGPTGTGKTLFAKCLAGYLDRPLLYAHCGLLGVFPEQFEQRLRHVFERARRTDAVLLFDDADVYVSKRTGDPTRSAIIGAFLKYLELHQTLVVIASNDVVDSAVVSRCSIVLDMKGELHTLEVADLVQMYSKQYQIDMSYELMSSGIFGELSARGIKQVFEMFGLLSIRRPKESELIKVISLVKGS